MYHDDNVNMYGAVKWLLVIIGADLCGDCVLSNNRTQLRSPNRITGPRANPDRPLVCERIIPRFMDIRQMDL